MSDGLDSFFEKSPTQCHITGAYAAIAISVLFDAFDAGMIVGQIAAFIICLQPASYRCCPKGKTLGRQSGGTNGVVAFL